MTKNEVFIVINLMGEAESIGEIFPVGVEGGKGEQIFSQLA